MNNAIESEWFEYESWDSYDLDYGDIVFHNCKLKKDIGNFKAGEFVPDINVIYSKSIIEIYDGKETFRNKIKLTIEDYV